MYQSGTKLIWVIVIVFATVIGAIIDLAVGRPKPGRYGRSARPHRLLPSSASGLPRIAEDRMLR
jgi:hypothetical protein